MGHAIGTVTGGAGDEAHYKVLAAIRALAMANGWTVLRYTDAGPLQELILNSAGLSGTEDIYIGFRTYSSVSGDYYNILVGTFTGYVSANSFDSQPGARLSGVPCHNNAVTYFITANPQRIAGCFKVGTPVYTHFYAGKMFPYSRPGEFPSPLVCAGMFNGAAGKRFSDTDYRFPYHGRESGGSNPNVRPSYLWLRDQAGAWRRLSHFPFYNGSAGSDTSSAQNALANWNYLGGGDQSRALVPAGTNYQPQPIILYTTSSVAGTWEGAVYGELDGVYAVSGFNNNVENVLQVGGTYVDPAGLSVADHVADILASGGRAFVVLQDVNQTDWRSFVALEMT